MPINYSVEYPKLQQRCSQAEADRDALLEALKRFGHHRIGCPVLTGTGVCNCGLNAAFETGRRKQNGGTDGMF